MSRLNEMLSRLGPDGVGFRPLGEMLEPVRNIRWSDSATYEYVDLSSVDRDTHKINVTTTIDRQSAPSRAQQVLRTDDVLFGATRPLLRRYASVPEDYDGHIASTGFCVLRANPSVLLPRFLFHVVGSTDFYTFVEAHQKGASYPSISDRDVKQYRTPVPPLEIQREMVRVLDYFTELEAELKAELEAELEARRMQYTAYRDRLLSFSERGGSLE